MAKFEVSAGWTVQAFQFALDCTPEQAACVRRQFGGRRYARNWAVRTLKSDIGAYRASGVETDKPSFIGMPARWNRVKDNECIDAETGGYHIHCLTTRLAKTHGEIVVEGLDAAGMLRQKGPTGARARRRGLSDSALGEPRRQLGYKTRWYGSHLTIADRWYPSSKTCHTCGRVQNIGWAQHWTCDPFDGGCGATHQRDDNAAINLARHEVPATGHSAVGPVRAAVKRGADRETRPGRAGGREARKGRSHPAVEQPREGGRVA
jgi:Putative transposase DNA-binding domain/Helix-turn-helix domain